MTCADIEPLLAAAADGLLDSQRQARVDIHLGGCDACRSALDDQRQVAAILASAALDDVSPAFLAQVNDRIDEAESVFGIVDCRAWTLRLAPLAAALAIAAYLGLGARPSSTSATQTQATAASSTTTFSPTNTADWERDVPSEALLEAALSRAGESNGR